MNKVFSSLFLVLLFAQQNNLCAQTTTGSTYFTGNVYLTPPSINSGSGSKIILADGKSNGLCHSIGINAYWTEFRTHPNEGWRFIASTKSSTNPGGIDYTRVVIQGGTGFLGLGTTAPTAQLHTTGTVRLEGLPQNNAYTKILVADANNNLAWRDASTLGGGISYTAGTGIDVTNGIISNTGDLSATNEIQDLSLAGTTLSISNDATTVDLTPYLDNTDAQTLSVSGNTLFISGGNSVTLPTTNHFAANGTHISNTNTGNVGFGTTNPGNKLEINSGSTTQPNASGLRFTNLKSTTPSTTANGKVLTVNANGDVILVNDAVGSGWGLAGNSISSTQFLGTTSSSTFKDLVFKSNGVERMRIVGAVGATAGNVGIGTTAPKAKLHIDGGAVLIGDGTTWMPGYNNSGNIVDDYGLIVSKGKGILTTELKVALKNDTEWYDDETKLERNLAKKAAEFDQNKHLTSIPSADELVKGGIDVKTMFAQMVKEHEETLLFLRDLKKEIDALKVENETLKATLNK